MEDIGILNLKIQDIERRLDFLEKESEKARENIGKIYDRVFEQQKELGKNEANDAQLRERVKWTTGKKVKAGVKWGAIITTLGTILSYLGTL